MPFRLRSLGAILFGAMALSTAANTGPAFERLVVFGDSLSDNGNAGRFSNGPVWVEHLAGKLGLGLTPASNGGDNFAVGGARLDPRSGPYNLRAQADRFLGMPPPQGTTLYIVYGGGNDLLAAIGAPDADAMIRQAASSLDSIVADLVARGATDILVPNLPDVGITPGVQALGDRAVAEAGRLTDRFNAAVDRRIAALAADSEARLHRLDVHALAERARADPSAFGFVDVTTPCQGRTDCAGHLFWDRVHPTTMAHGRLADAALRVLSDVRTVP